MRLKPTQPANHAGGADKKKRWHFPIEGDPDLSRKAVWSCYQENPVDFRGYSLYYPGAYPEPPLSGKLTWRITQPWAEILDDKERKAKRKAQELMDKLRARSKADQEKKS